MRNKVRIDTQSDAMRFITIANTIDCPVYLTDGNFRADGKSMLGVMYGMSEFKNLWVECEKDVYMKFKDFIIID